MDEGERIESALREFWTQKTSDSNEWLRTIYSAHSDRLIHDNGSIWSIGSILIPASFGALIVPVSSDVTLVQTLLLALSSCFVLLAWNLIADNLRAFQNVHALVTQTIERLVLSLERPIPAKIHDKQRVAPISIRQIRWFLFVALVFSWLMLLFSRCID